MFYIIYVIMLFQSITTNLLSLFNSCIIIIYCTLIIFINPHIIICEKSLYKQQTDIISVDTDCQYMLSYFSEHYTDGRMRKQVVGLAPKQSSLCAFL